MEEMFISMKSTEKQLGQRIEKSDMKQILPLSLATVTDAREYSVPGVDNAIHVIRQTLGQR